MLVEAIRLGYYDLKRRYPGDQFHMKEKDYSVKGKDGQVKTCSWVALVDGETKKVSKRAKVAEESSSDQDVI
jgi:hypothetical protein